MGEKEIAFRVTGRLSFDYQIIVQAEDFEEAAYFASDIDLDKWIESGSDWEVLDVSKNYFLKRVKVEQPELVDDSALPSIVIDRK